MAGYFLTQCVKPPIETNTDRMTAYHDSVIITRDRHGAGFCCVRGPSMEEKT